MSLFANCTLEQALEIINSDYGKINSFDFTSLQERDLLVQVIKAQPGFFLQINPNNLFDDVVIAFLEVVPQMFVRVPKQNRTQKVKLKVLEKNPEIIEFFDLEDFDYDVVKYIYINYPDFLDEFDDPKIKSKVNSLIARLKSEGIVPNTNEEDEEDGE